jgi:2-keto-4-pentenoate hydratase/2-oxohepta-3-ene-1,7-dioic acid hydratase in catechol pathway
MSTELRVRFLDPKGIQRLGWLEGDQVRLGEGAWIGELRSTEHLLPLHAVRLLAPVEPSKIVAAATNYRRHAEEMGKAIPAIPKIFLKAPSAIVAHNEPVEIPPLTEHVDPEAEVALIVGRRLRRVSAVEGKAAIVGVVPLNDVTARDFQRADGVFSRAKGFDSFCPMGPAVGIGLDPDDLGVVGRVNGEVRQNGRTTDMIFDCGSLISFISHVMTLEAGDVIATGTPAGVEPIQAGDVMTVEIEGLPPLENPVRNRSDRR